MQRRKELRRKIDCLSGKSHTFPFVPRIYTSTPRASSKEHPFGSKFSISCNIRLTPHHEVFQAERECTSKRIFISFPQHAMYVLAFIKNIKQKCYTDGKLLCRPHIPNIFIVSPFLTVNIRYIILLSNIKSLQM